MARRTYGPLRRGSDGAIRRPRRYCHNTYASCSCGLPVLTSLRASPASSAASIHVDRRDDRPATRGSRRDACSRGAERSRSARTARSARGRYSSLRITRYSPRVAFARARVLPDQNRRGVLARCARHGAAGSDHWREDGGRGGRGRRQGLWAGRRLGGCARAPRALGLNLSTHRHAWRWPSEPERARQELNLRPLAPEASALSPELRARDSVKHSRERRS